MPTDERTIEYDDDEDAIFIEKIGHDESDNGGSIDHRQQFWKDEQASRDEKQEFEERLEQLRSKREEIEKQIDDLEEVVERYRELLPKFGEG